MKKEIWKDIPGYDGVYQASSLGNIRKILILSPSMARAYPFVGLTKNKKQKYFSVHQLVSMAFLGHIPNGQTLVVNHKDLNKRNPKLSNLEIIPQLDNLYYSLKRRKLNRNIKGYRWAERENAYVSIIYINKDVIYLGYYKSKRKAHSIYQTAFKNIKKYTGNKHNFRNLIKKLDT